MDDLLAPVKDAGKIPGGVGAIHDALFCKSSIRVTGFGRFYKGDEQDWTFRHYKRAEDGLKETSLSRHLPEIIKNLKLNNLLVPEPEFGNRVCGISQLTTLITLGSLGERARIQRGCKADICLLKAGETYAISTAGCVVVWAQYRGLKNTRVIAGHIGRLNLETAVDTLWQALNVPEFKEEKEAVHVGICFPIDPLQFEHRFDEPEFGEKNRALCESLVAQWGEQSVLGWANPAERILGCIDLGWVIRRQFAKRGVLTKHMHGTPMYDKYPHLDGLPIWYNTRGAFGQQMRRNLVLITNYG